MEYLIPIATSVASAMLVFLLQIYVRENRDLKRKMEEQHTKRETALENGVVSLLRDRLIEYHSKYMSQGYITSNALQNWLLMYDAYKALGGNGMIDHMESEIEELHIEKTRGR